MLFSPYFVVVRVPVVEERPQQTIPLQIRPPIFFLSHTNPRSMMEEEETHVDRVRRTSPRLRQRGNLRAKIKPSVNKSMHALRRQTRAAKHLQAEMRFLGDGGRRRRRRRRRRREERRSRDEEKDETTTRTRTRTPNGDTDVVPFPKR